MGEKLKTVGFTTLTHNSPSPSGGYLSSIEKFEEDIIKTLPLISSWKGARRIWTVCLDGLIYKTEDSVGAQRNRT